MLVAEIVLLAFFSVPFWSANVDAKPPDGAATEVRVVAEQFSWNFIHPDPAITPEVADAFSRRAVEHLVNACRDDLPTTVTPRR